MSAPLTFSEYEEAAASTRIYPAHARLLYPSMKLAGEAGEVAGKVGAFLGECGSDLLDEQALQAVALECGDVLWYLAAISHDLDLPLEALARYPAPAQAGDLAAYAHDLRSQRPHMHSPLLRLTLRLNEAAGSVVETLGKLMRDSGWKPGEPLGSTELNLLATKARLVFEVLTHLADETGFGLEGVANGNMRKLASRKDRGVIQGSGDAR